MAFRPEPAAPQLRVDLAVFAGAFSLSPDGRELAYVARTNGAPMISIRSLEDGTTRLLAGTEGARSIFWAPDGRSIGFLGGGPTSRVDLSDGAIHVLHERGTDGAPNGAWNPDGDILYPASGVSPLMRLNPARPGLSEATTLGDGEVSHLAPYFLADGRRFIYFVRGEKPGIYLGSLEGGTPRQLVTSDGGGVIAAGHLVFPRQGALVAQPFDLERMEPSGEAFRIAEPEDQHAASVVYSVSSSADGTLAFRPSAPAQNELVWFSRAGTELGRVPDSAGADTPELSSDGRRLLANRGADLWTFDLTREIWAPLQTTGGYGAWSADGRSIAYMTITRGNLDFHTKPAELAAPAERVLSTSTLKKLLQWSPDGRFLLYTSQRDDGLDNDILALPLEGDRTPIPLVSTRFWELDARFSPDGRWIAYQSNETGRYEIFAQPFPGPGQRVQISTTGGAQVQWSGDGQEIFYVALDERLMAVPLMRSTDGARIEPGEAAPLFTTRIQNGAVQPGARRQQYVAAPDGQRFLINTLVDDAEPRPITLLFNWKPERRAAAAR
jgi:Tol biopolymer transport system component